MGIEAKDIQVFMCRIIKLSFDIFCRFVQKHPIISSVLFLLLVLYLFLPKIFFFLIYSSPFLACAAVYIRFYLPSKCTKFRNDVENEKKDQANSSTISNKSLPADHVVSRNDASVAQSQTISQRSVKNKELDAQAKEEKSMVSLTSPADDSIGKTVLIAEIPRVASDSDRGESILRNASVGENIGGFSRSSKSSLTSLDGLEEQAAKSEGGGGEADLESSSEEDAQKVMNKALEWTEDDQKNLMDLGISELERNKRLESLIARRRARKLYKMNTEKILTHNNAGQIPIGPVIFARSNTFCVPNDPDDKIPGSAPSVLLPTRNPFDLPYDPLEEKPNLMADSFQQEFMSAHQKEMFFCRPASFTWGPSFPPEGKHNDSDIAGHSEFKTKQDAGDNDWLVDHELNQEDKTLRRSLSITDLVTEEGESSNRVENQPEEDGEADHRTDIKGKKIENTHGSDSSADKGNEIQIGTHGFKHDRSESSLSSLSDENEPIVKSKKTATLTKIQPPAFRFPDIMNSPSTNPDPCPIPKARTVSEVSYIASPATIDRSRIDNHLLYTNNGPWHTPTNSIASDMQVEVSEIGSPPLTGDGSVSSDGGESLTYDGDVEKEITSESDEMWGVSPHAPKAQELEMTSRGVDDFGREDITGCFSGFHTEPEAPFASSSRPNIPQDGKTDSINSDDKKSNDAEQCEGNLQKPQELLNPSEKTEQEIEISYNIDAPDHINDDTEGPNSVEDRYGGVEKSITSEVIHDLSKMGDEINSESSRQIEGEPLSNTAQSVAVADMAYSIDDLVVRANVTKEDVQSSEERNERIEKYIEQDVLVDLSKRAEESSSESGRNYESNSDNPPANLSFFIPTQDGIEEQSTREAEVSSVNQSSNNSSTSGIQPEMAVEQPSVISSTSSSPKSVLPDRIPLTETSSDLNQEMQMDVSEYNMEEEKIDTDKLLDEQSPERLHLTSNQNAQQHVTEDSASHLSVDMPQISEEASKSTGRSTDETRQLSNINESELDDGGTKEDIKSLSATHVASDASKSDEASMELSKPPDEINSISVEQVNGTAGNLTEYEAITYQSKPERDQIDLKLSGVTVAEQESKSPSQEFTEDADGNSEAKDLTECGTAAAGDHIDMPVNTGAEEQVLLQNSIASNDAVAKDTTSTDSFELVEDREHDSKRNERKENTTEQSSVIEDHVSGSIEVSETGSRNLTENAVSNVQFKPGWEGNSSNGMRYIDEAARQEGNDSSKAVEDF